MFLSPEKQGNRIIRVSITQLKKKTRVTEGIQFFTNYTSDRGVTSKRDKELKKPNNKKTNYSIKKWDINLNRELPNEETQMVEKHL